MFISSHYTVEMPCEIEEIGAEAFHSHGHTAEILVLPKGSQNYQGFHSRGPVCIQIYRSLGCGNQSHDLDYYKEDATPQWSVEVKVSEAKPEDGWRDSEYLSDQHNTNLAKAILGAIEIAKHLRGFTEQYEAAYQKARAERQRQRDEQKARREAELAADPAIGERNAELLLQRVRKAAKTSAWASMSLPLINRGSPEPRVGKIGVYREWGGPVCIRYARKRINQERAKELLADSSFRAVRGILKAVREHEKRWEAEEIHTHADTQPV